MHISNQEQLKRQRKKLSMLFTVILFGVVTILQIVLLVGRYIDSSNREFKRMAGELPRVKMMGSIIFTGDIKNQFPQMLPMPNGGKGWRLKGGNMVVYKPQNDEIIMSSLGDDLLAKELIHKAKKEGGNQGSILYNKNKFLFVKEGISPDSQTIFFIPAQMNLSDIIAESGMFIIFFGLCCLIFYKIIYRFVGRIFIPIEENIKDMEQFVFNAGHELKTPLSVIKSSLQLAVAKQQYHKAIEESIQEVDSMNKLIESLINLSTIQQDEKERVDLEGIIQEKIKQYQLMATQYQCSISLDIESPVYIETNRSHIEMLISNLLSNAIKYNKKNGFVKISLNRQELTIKDSGIGIPQKDISKVYDRFFQVGGARNQQGFGIGLSLVKKIVDVYGWKINLISTEGQGTIITIKF